jgi:signal transduction histidine kinase
MTRAQVERTAIAVAALGLGVAAADAARRAPGFSLAGDSRARLALGVAAGWAVLAAGISLHRSGSRAVGRLLATGGCAWLAGGLATPGARTAPLFTLGLTATMIAAAPIGWALLVAAGDRLRRPDRVVVAALWVTLGALLGLLPTFADDPVATGCGACPSNLLGLVDSPGTATALSRAGVRLGLIAIGACVALAVFRLVRAPEARRQRALLLVPPGCAYLVLVAAQLGHAWRSGFPGSDLPEQTLWTAQAAALLAMAAGVGLLHLAARRRRWRLAQLVVELAGAPRPGGLGEALANLLGDPGLELLHPSQDGWIDAGGHVRKPPAEAATTPLLRDGAPVALLHHRPELLEDPRAVAELERGVRLGLDHERLQAQLRHQLAHLRRSRADLTAASESERRLLERDLHDGAQQRLAAFTFAVGLARQRAAPELDARLQRAQREVHHALEELREIAHGLYPVALAEAGLAAAIESLADRRPGLQPGEMTAGRFPPAVEETAYFVIATLADHWAPRPVTVRTERDRERLLIDLQASASLPHDLVAIEDRLSALDGTLTLHAPEPGQTRVTAELPCA